MQLEQALESVVGLVVPSEFGRFRDHIDPAWIEEALWATGTASLRRRRLPAEQAIWLVLGMALLRRESIDRVAKMSDGFWNELPDNSITIADRNFLVADDLTRLQRSGRNRHWLTRAKSTTKLRVLRRLGRNDDLVEITLSDQTRRAYPDLPPVWTARAIRYQRKGFRPSTLLTSLVDAEQFPSNEIVALYHERWEIELGYDEIKTHLLEREEAIRSRTPAGVRQELWAIALGYNLVRVEMARVALEAGVQPNRISFVTRSACANGRVSGSDQHVAARFPRSPHAHALRFPRSAHEHAHTPGRPFRGAVIT